MTPLESIQLSQEPNDYLQQQQTLKKSIKARLLSVEGSLEEDNAEFTKFTREGKLKKRNNGSRKGRTNKNVNRIMSSIDNKKEDMT